MNPSEARARILSEHCTLRGRLSEIELRLVSKDRGELSGRLAELSAALGDHIAYEESVLIPVLRTIDAWGPVRVDRLRRDHEEQLRHLNELAAGWALEVPVGELCDLTRTFIMMLREDMDMEERETLRADLLRDDVIAVDQTSS